MIVFVGKQPENGSDFRPIIVFRRPGSGVGVWFEIS